MFVLVVYYFLRQLGQNFQKIIVYEVGLGHAPRDIAQIELAIDELQPFPQVL
jgi:hypothetical protein